jgi:hypothetical protein
MQNMSWRQNGESYINGVDNIHSGRTEDNRMWEAADYLERTIKARLRLGGLVR